MRLEAIVILLLVFLVACKPAPAWTALDTRTPSPARLPPTRVFSGSDKLGGAVIIYQRSGGLTGISEQWTVYPDGRITSAQGPEYRVSPEHVSSLLKEIESSGFFEMSENSGRFSP